MFLQSRKPYLTCLTALCACVSSTAILLFAGIAAACSGVDPPKCPTPSATTEGATFVGSSSAELHGSVEAHGCETTYTFKVGPSTSYGYSVSGYAGWSNFSTSVQDQITGLQPSTTYHYRLYATNSGGTGEGADKTFTTTSAPVPPAKDPSATTEAATGVSSSGATLNGAVNPNGLATTYKFEYGTVKGDLTKSTGSFSAGSGTSSAKVKGIEVNLEPSTLYYFRISATNSEGTTTGSELSFTTSASPWKIKATPNPEGASDSNLYDVSCEPSTSVCTAVGKSTSSGVESPTALRWNGVSWSEQVAAKKSGATHTRLFGVDCPSETRCLAVGNYQSSEGPTLLSEIWNEGKWSVQTTPVPTESTSSEFVAIGCNSTATCTAVGSAVIGGVKTAIAERWTSPTWALSSIPIPEGATSSQLDGVDCLWSNFCVAVGRYTSEGSTKSLVEFWNGTEWSLQTVTDPAGAVQSTLLDVACTPTPNRCTAVGGWKNNIGEQFTLAYRFNGTTTWTLQSTPNPIGSIASVFQEVSCASELSCAADGSWVKSGESNRSLAEAWNGTSWSIQGTPNPSSAGFTAFFGLSCRSTTCMGVGWSTNSSGVDTTLSEFRE
jgi:hypothetical protein